MGNAKVETARASERRTVAIDLKSIVTDNTNGRRGFESECNWQ